MAEKMLNFRCSEDLIEKIDGVGRGLYPADNASGCDRSKTLKHLIQVAIQAIDEGFVLPQSDSVRQDENTVLPKVLQVLREDVEALKAQMEEVLQSVGK